MYQKSIIKWFLITLALLVNNSLFAQGSYLYKKNCFSCHDAGLVNSPKLGDKKAWNSRLNKSIDAMVKTVVTGKSAMPPRGGTQYTDAQIKEVVIFMLEKVK